MLLISLTACSRTGNPDHDYVLALMEKGDYAMAIQVLEHLQAQSGTGTQPLPATEAVEETTQPAAVLTAIQQLATDTVIQFMADKGNALVTAYEAHSGTRARIPTVVHAIEYRLGNCDGNGSSAHCLLISMEADIYADDGFCDRLQLLVDMDTQTVYNSAQIDQALLSRENPANEDEFNHFLLNSYYSYIIHGADQLWEDSEIRETLTDTDLTAINNALNEGLL